MEPSVTTPASPATSRLMVLLSLFTAFSVIAVSMSFGRFSLGLLAPQMRSTIGLGYTGIGLLLSANLVGYFPDSCVIPIAAIGRSAANDQLRSFLAGYFFQLFIIYQPGFSMHPVKMGLI